MDPYICTAKQRCWVPVLRIGMPSAISGSHGLKIERFNDDQSLTTPFMLQMFMSMTTSHQEPCLIFASYIT